MTEKKTRAPGGGRKPLPVSERLYPVTVRLSPAQLEFCRKRGGVSEYVRKLVDEERKAEAECPHCGYFLPRR